MVIGRALVKENIKHKLIKNKVGVNVFLRACGWFGIFKEYRGYVCYMKGVRLVL